MNEYYDSVIMQNSGSPQLDLTGKLIIKVALGDDIRRIPIHNEDITYDELVLMMQRVYRGKLSTNDEVTIKYKDEDGDLITIFDSSDLSFAIQCSRILKITLFVGGPKSLLGQSDTASVRRELQEIRDRVIDLLDRLEPSPLVGATQGLSLAEGISSKGDVARESPLPLSNGVKAINSVGGKEFDPLKSQLSNDSTQNKVMASFGGSDSNASQSVSHAFDRAATPDSISSVGSSTSNQVKAQQQPGADQQQHMQRQQPQQHPQQQQQPQQQLPHQQQQPSAYQPNQPSYPMTHPGQMPQMYAGQPGYPGVQQVPGQPAQQPQQQQPQAVPPTQQQMPPVSQQQQVPPQQQQPGYDSGMYNQYNNPSYPGAAGPPGPNQMYGQQQQQQPNPYGQAPGMPQMPQSKAPGYGPTPPGQPQPGQSPGNPYSRGAPTYSSGYPRPSAGYPQ